MLDKENLMKIEFTSKIAGVHAIEMVALYNKNRITKEEVKNVIDTDSYSPYVIIVEKEQFQKVFIK